MAGIFKYHRGHPSCNHP